jgi:hypothetical protein
MDVAAAQVRCCMTCDLGVVTASRDKTLRLWVATAAPLDQPGVSNSSRSAAGADGGFVCLNTFVSEGGVACCACQSVAREAACDSQRFAVVLTS